MRSSFSALTGLRWSDIESWFGQKCSTLSSPGITSVSGRRKQREQKHCPFQNKAFSVVRRKRKPDDKVFEGLYYSAWHNLKLREWVMKAGITKHITFTVQGTPTPLLQITLGTDIYTVSKLLGHRHLKQPKFTLR